MPSDPASIGFHVYRTTRRDVAGQRITETPITTATNFAEFAEGLAGRIYYRVRSVDAAGKEGPPSEWAAATNQAV